MRYFYILLLPLLIHSAPIVFVHLGKQLPDYLSVSIAQARLFHPDWPIFLIANRVALEQLPEQLTQCNLQCAPCEDLPQSPMHAEFLQRSQLDRSFREGFWTYTTERFFYLYELMQQQKLDELFHLENDVMLYTNLATLLPIFHSQYNGKIAVTLDNEDRCIPGFLYISTLPPLHKLLSFIADRSIAHSGNDMLFLARFHNLFQGRYIDSLPIIMPQYAQEHGLRSRHNHSTDTPELFYRNIDLFESLFDGAAIGQYLGGEDPRNGSCGAGFVNESCLFHADRLKYEWQQDSAGRWVPFGKYQGKLWKINNLHIHSKKLNPFYSLRSS
jgi:hypothetical protein